AKRQKEDAERGNYSLFQRGRTLISAKNAQNNRSGHHRPSTDENQCRSNGVSAKTPKEQTSSYRERQKEVVKTLIEGKLIRAAGYCHRESKCCASTFACPCH